MGAGLQHALLGMSNWRLCLHVGYKANSVDGWTWCWVFHRHAETLGIVAGPLATPGLAGTPLSGEVPDARLAQMRVLAAARSQAALSQSQLDPQAPPQPSGRQPISHKPGMR